MMWHLVYTSITTGFRCFVECLMHSAKAILGSTRQRASGKKSVGKEFFADRLLSGTRRVQSRHSAKKSPRHGTGSVSTCFAECHVRGARQRFFNFFFQNFFAECPTGEALGKDFFLIISLPRALLGRRSANIFYFFFVISLPSARVRALGKEANFFWFYIHKHNI